MYSKIAVLAIALVGSSVALPSLSRYHVLHESRDLEGPSRHAWSKRAPVPVGRELPVRIGLTQSNLDIAHDLLMEVSAHDSPRFGKHYTSDEVTELFAPSHDTVAAVSAWLKSAGIKDVSQSVNKQWLQFDIAVENLESLLKTTYHEFVHHDTGNIHVACDEYHVPADIQEHIDYITPGIKLHMTQRRRKNGNAERRSAIEKRTNFRFPPIYESSPSNLTEVLTKSNIGVPFRADKAYVCDSTTCDYHITPGCVRLLYNVTAPTTSVPGNQLGIFEDLGDILDQKDLNQFYSILAPKIPKGTGPILNLIDGAPGLSNQASGGYESTLDFELAFPLVYPQGIVLFQTDDLPTENNYTYDGFLNNFFDAIDGSYCTYSAFGETGNSPIDPPYPDPQPGGYKGKLQCGKYEPTNVISISYGGPEAEMPVNYQRRQCNEAMKLGLQGVSIVVASGDSGVASRNDTSDHVCLGEKNRIFNPDFPANCPYITSVGATFLPYPRNAFEDAEVAVNRFASGGGFSNIYPMPSYQQAAVENYLSLYPPSFKSYETLYNETSYNGSGFGVGGGVYNRIGRAYPDFAAAGDGIVVVSEGALIIEGGTSASAPIFAGILTRINEERLLANKSTIGFVNPTLYANPDVLHDITKGNNRACEGNGFVCGTGWDPVTGNGTPNFGKMLELYMSLP